MNILIAEDEKTLLKTMAFFLQKKGYHVTIVENGLAADEQIRKSNFDLIITDLNMPYIGGMELVNTIRNVLKLATPVIVLTSTGPEQTQLHAFEVGASEFITKPFSLPVLATRVERLISGKTFYA